LLRFPVGDEHLDVDRDDLIVVADLFLRARRPALRLQRAAILSVPRDAILLRHHLGRLQHRHVVQALTQMLFFSKNVSIFGGLLYVAARGSGRVALKRD